MYDVSRFVIICTLFSYFCLCDIVCLPRLRPDLHPSKESCDYVVEMIREKATEPGVEQLQAFVPEHVAPRKGQQRTPALFIDRRHSTMRERRTCAARIEVLVGKKPASITLDTIIDILQNIISYCLVRQRTVGWARSGTDSRVKIRLEPYTQDEISSLIAARPIPNISDSTVVMNPIWEPPINNSAFETT